MKLSDKLLLQQAVKQAHESTNFTHTHTQKQQLENSNDLKTIICVLA